MSSFTFNSDPRAEDYAPASRPGILGPVVVLMGALLGLVVVGVTRKEFLPEDQRAILWGDPAEVRTLVLGDSTEAGAIDSSLLGAGSVNLAVAGSGFSAWEPIFDSALARCPNLNTVILSGDPMSLLRDGLGPRKGDYKDLVQRGAKTKGLPGLSYAEKLDCRIRHDSPLSGLLAGPKLSWPEICRVLRDQQILQPIQQHRYGVNDGAEKKSGYVRMFADEGHVEQNRSALRRILQKAKARELRVILVRTPVTGEFHETEQEKWEPWGDEINLLARGMLPEERLQILEPPAQADYGYSDFADPNHLNETGRRKFTEWLVRKMEARPWPAGGDEKSIIGKPLK